MKSPNMDPKVSFSGSYIEDVIRVVNYLGFRVLGFWD